MSIHTKVPCCNLAYCQEASRINAAILAGESHVDIATTYNLDLPTLLSHVKHFAHDGWPTQPITQATTLTDLQKRLAAFQAQAKAAIALASEGEDGPETPDRDAGDDVAMEPQEGTVATSCGRSEPGQVTEGESAASTAKRASNRHVDTVVADVGSDGEQDSGAASSVVEAGGLVQGETWQDADSGTGEGPADGKEGSVSSYGPAGKVKVCCHLAKHPRALEIDAELLECKGSVRGLATKYGVASSAIQLHKGHVGLRIVAPLPAALSVDEVAQFEAKYSDALRPRVTVDIMSSHYDNLSIHGGQTVTVDDSAGHGVNEQIMTRTHVPQVLSNGPSENAVKRSVVKLANNDEARVLLGERIGQIANLVSLDKWNDRATVLGLVKQWGCSEQEVERLHAIASGRVRANRGNAAAQLEVAVATYKAVIAREKSYAASCYSHSLRTAMQGKGKEASMWKGLASTSSANIVATQKAIDAITIAKTQALTIQVGVSADPDFAGAMRVLATVFDALYPASDTCPGASADGEHALELWENGGDAVVGAWVRKEKARREAALFALPAQGGTGHVDDA